MHQVLYVYVQAWAVSASSGQIGVYGFDNVACTFASVRVHHYVWRVMSSQMPWNKPMPTLKAIKHNDTTWSKTRVPKANSFSAWNKLTPWCVFSLFHGNGALQVTWAMRKNARMFHRILQVASWLFNNRPFELHQARLSHDGRAIDLPQRQVYEHLHVGACGTCLHQLLKVKSKQQRTQARDTHKGHQQDLPYGMTEPGGSKPSQKC